MNRNKNLLPSLLTHAAIGVGALGMLAVLSPAAHAADHAIEVGNQRVTAVPMQRYENESRIVRQRTPGKHAVTFSAMPEAIDDGAVVVFEIESVSHVTRTERWRCVAQKNVSECFDKPVRINYLDDDRKVVMKVRVEPEAKKADFLARR